MTERTVTVPTETEETITLCNECGLSDDAGEILTYIPSEEHWEDESNRPDFYDKENLDTEFGPLHLHEGCLDDLGVDVPEAPTYADIAPKTTEADGTVAHALDTMDRNSILFSIALFCAGTYFILDGNLVGFGLAAIIGLVFLTTALSASSKRAQATIDEIQNND